MAHDKNWEINISCCIVSICPVLIWYKLCFHKRLLY